jgi:ADP-ribosyl-[dinitrogen reductase] hydrolase
LIGAGVTYFIDLTQPGELPPYDHLLPPSRADDGRYVIYVRKAIRDHGLPQEPEAMQDILDYLERALEVGHRVYVHCRAGIGRTNMVVGCWLRRGGLSGAAALERLNGLWQGNARSRLWPRVPETEDQTRYILDWREPDENPFGRLNLAAAGALRARYQGCLLGLACGDAIGATLQFRPHGQFAPIADMLGGGHWRLQPGAWTDDTAMSLCLAESLLAQEDCVAADQLQRYRRWQKEGTLSSTGECIGITAAVARALAGPGSSPRTVAMGQSAQALTRVGAVALYSASAPERVFAWTATAVEITDDSAEILAACQCYASLLLAALRGASLASLLPDARDLLRRSASAAPAPGLAQLLADLGDPAGTALGDPGAAGDPRAALRWIVAVLAKSAGFRDGLLRVANRGGDADIHGAIFGQLAGALYGVEGIPKPWRKAILRRDLLQDFADRLLVAALSPRT